MERISIQHLLLAVTLLTPLARAEHDSWDRTREASRFLSNAPGAYNPPVENSPAEAPDPAVSARRRMERERERQEKERREALQQLEFRRNVEDAMRKILSFQPSPRAVAPGAFGSRASEPEAAGLYEADPDGLNPRERLVYQAVGNGYRPPQGRRELARVEPVEPPPRPRQPATFNPELPRGLDESFAAEPVSQPYTQGAPAAGAVAPSPEEDLIPALPGGYEVVPDRRPIRVISDGEDANVTRLRR